LVRFERGVEMSEFNKLWDEHFKEKFTEEQVIAAGLALGLLVKKKKPTRVKFCLLCRREIKGFLDHGNACETANAEVIWMEEMIHGK